MRKGKFWLNQTKYTSRRNT